MKKVISLLMCLVMALCLMLPLGIAANAASSDTTVYITKTGECYHSAGCQYLRKSCIAISLGDAVADGYRACSKCNPPSLTSENTTPVAQIVATPAPTPMQTPTPAPIMSAFPTKEEITEETAENTVYTKAGNKNDGSSVVYIVAIVVVGAGAYFAGRGRRGKK